MFGVVLSKSYSGHFLKIHRKVRATESIFSSVVDLLATLLKKHSIEAVFLSIFFDIFQTIYSISLFLTITTFWSFNFLFNLHFRVSIIYKSQSKVVAKLQTEYLCCKGWTNIRQDKTETDECSIRKNHFFPIANRVIHNSNAQQNHNQICF